MFSKGLFHPGKEVHAGDLIMSGVGLLSALQQSKTEPSTLAPHLLTFDFKSTAVQSILCCRDIIAAHRQVQVQVQSPGVSHQVGVSLSTLNTAQDLDEIPKAEAVRAVKHCDWAVDPGKDDCVALEGSFSYYSYSWYMGEPPVMLADSSCFHPILVTWRGTCTAISAAVAMQDAAPGWDCMTDGGLEEAACAFASH